MKMTTQERTEAVRTLVVATFLTTGDGLTVKQIASALGWSETTARRAAFEPSGFPASPDLRCEAEWRASYSRDYPGMEAGGHKVDVLYPTRDCLRRMVLTA